MRLTIQRAQKCPQIIRQGRNKLHSLMSSRMLDHKSFSMQGVTRQRMFQSGVGLLSFASLSTIKFVTHERKSQIRQMDANLMGAPRARPEPQQADPDVSNPWEKTFHAPFGNGISLAWQRV
jgi:hypothetical protein